MSFGTITGACQTAARPRIRGPRRDLHNIFKIVLLYSVGNFGGIPGGAINILVAQPIAHRSRRMMGFDTDKAGAVSGKDTGKFHFFSGPFFLCLGAVNVMR